MTLIEVMVVTGILLVTALGMMALTTNQQKATRFLEFQLKREQLRMVLLGQFLNDPDNCKCLFQGANPYPATGAAQLTGVAPTAIGDYQFVTPGNCATATMPSPFVTNAGVDGVRSTAIQLVNVTATSGLLRVQVESTKEVVGATVVKPIEIPVAISTIPSGSNVLFQTCAASGAGGGGSMAGCRLVLETFDNDNCSGNTMVRYSDWIDTSSSLIHWTGRDSGGNPIGSYGGRNRNPGDIACMRVGIQCSP